MDELVPFIRDSGYSYEELAKGVYILYDFISEEERLAYYKLASESEEVDWTIFYLLGLQEQALEKYNRSDIATLVHEGLININPQWMDKVLGAASISPIPISVAKRAQELFPKEKYEVDGYDAIQRHYPGSDLPEHIDSDHNSNLKYATVIYLNDNYQGGHLFFRDLGLKIRPPIRSLLIFSSDLLHGVEKVLDGPHRYVVANFIFNRVPND
jgi:hypothetical protein